MFCMSNTKIKISLFLIFMFLIFHMNKALPYMFVFLVHLTVEDKHSPLREHVFHLIISDAITNWYLLNMTWPNHCLWKDNSTILIARSFAWFSVSKIYILSLEIYCKPNILSLATSAHVMMLCIYIPLCGLNSCTNYKPHSTETCSVVRSAGQ